MAETPGGENLLFLTDEQLRKGIEAMFFAYRGFTADPDRILEGKDYGRAHHRAIHFIHRSPGTTVSNLLSILGVTKQSLNRVLRTLIEDGLVRSEKGKVDARGTTSAFDGQGTDAGTGIVRCSGRGCGRRTGRRPQAVQGFRQVLEAMMDPEMRRQYNRLKEGWLMVPDAHLLIVDDDERIRALLQKFLVRNGFLVSVARDAAQARRIPGRAGVRPDRHGCDDARRGRGDADAELRKKMATPILLLTARGGGNRIEGLEAGADDYLVKPFEPKERSCGSTRSCGGCLR